MQVGCVYTGAAVPAFVCPQQQHCQLVTCPSMQHSTSRTPVADLHSALQVDAAYNTKWCESGNTSLMPSGAGGKECWLAKEDLINSAQAKLEPDLR